MNHNPSLMVCENVDGSNSMPEGDEAEYVCCLGERAAIDDEDDEEEASGIAEAVMDVESSSDETTRCNPLWRCILKKRERISIMRNQPVGMCVSVRV